MQAASAPTPPDPFATASAQQVASVEVAIANTEMANANEDTPQATVTYSSAGTYTMVTPHYDSTGASNGTTTQTIPLFLRTVALKTKEQAIFDANQSTRLSMNTWANNQITQITGVQANVFDLATAGLTNRPDSIVVPTLSNPGVTPGALVTSIGTGDLITYRSTIQTDMLVNINYNITIDRTNLISRLSEQGITAGMPAYSRALFAFDKQSDNARIEAYLKSGMELSRLVMLQEQEGRFANDVQQIQFRQGMLVIEFGNGILLAQFQTRLANANYVLALREDALKEALVARNQPLAELSALVHGGQPQIPQFQQFRAGVIAQPQIAEDVYRSADLAQNAWRTQSAYQMQMTAGLIGMAGNMLAAPTTGGGSLIGGLL